MHRSNEISLLNRMSAGLFSCSLGPGGGSEDWMPKIKVTVEIKMSRYSHKNVPDAKFEFGSFSSFGDMTSQNFPLKKGQVFAFGYLSPENGFNFKKMSFYVQNCSCRPKIDPPVSFTSFQASWW